MSMVVMQGRGVHKGVGACRFDEKINATLGTNTNEEDEKCKKTKIKLAMQTYKEKRQI